MDSPIVVLDLMVQNEECVGSLYRAYADRFPKLADLWLSLAEQEQNHAAWLRHMKEAAMDGAVTLSNHFSINALTSYKAYLVKEITAAEDPNLGLSHALVTAVYLEESLIERDFFDIFINPSEEMSEVLHELAAEEKVHLAKLRQARGQNLAADRSF